MIADRARGRSITRRGLLIAGLGLMLLAGVYVLALRFTPMEVSQGLAQKIFYLHVPAAWTSLLVFSVVGITSAVYLWLRDERLDLFAASSAEVGVVFSIIMLTTGPLWAKPIWGTWWQWDARLTLTLFLFFLFVGYLSLRAAVPDPGERARYSAVVAILGFLLVPFVHLSVYLFRTIHPMPVVLKPSAPSLPDSMLRTLLIAFAVDLVLYIGFVTARYGLGLLAHARAAELEDRPDA
ncbi:MAG TPA: cytochrome c biogenesis protein CcsA [Gemmatimonadales bacterium]|jgi:heme exporter protein C|nr:cytochrome c biogenesis protein CcsA [Gemmatimonadales bacterium]